MLFTIIHLLVVWFQRNKEKQRIMQYMKLIRSNKNCLAVCKKKFQQKEPHIGSRLSSVLDSSQRHLKETVFLEENNTVLATVPTNVSISLGRWTSYLDKQKYQPPMDSDVCHLLVSLVAPEDVEEFVSYKLELPSNKRHMVLDFVSAVAWKPGNPFGIIVESTVEKGASMLEAFIDDQLFTDELLEIQEITTVDIGGRAVNLMRTGSDPGPLEFPLSPRAMSLSDIRLAGEAATEDRNRKLSNVDEHQFDQTDNSIASFGSGDLLDEEDAEQDAPRDRDAWPEMHPKDPAISGCAVIMEGSSAAGEAPSEPIEVLAPEVFTPYRRRDAQAGKPPNVLIYCGKKDSARIFASLKSVFEQCLNPDKYAVYHLAHGHVFTTPWAENTTLLIVSGSKVYDGVDKAFLEYFRRGGAVLSFSSMFSAAFMPKVETTSATSVLSLTYRHWRDVTVISGRNLFDDADCLQEDVSLNTLARDKPGNAVIVEASHEISTGVAIISQAKLDKDPVLLAISPDIFAALKKANPTRFEILTDLFIRLGIDCQQGDPPALSPTFLFAITNDLKTQFLESVRTRLRGGLLRSKEITLKFVDKEENPDEEVHPVIRNARSGSLSFDVELYKMHLKSKVLGNTVFYTPVIKTTMTMFEGLLFSVPDSVGLIAIADRQTSGKGRGGNVWISPAGCAMFTLHVRVDVNTELGQRVAYLQHIQSLAVVEAVRSKPGYEDIDLRLKWPNDIYFGSTMKLGGVIVNSSCMQTTIHGNIGCGFNVSNRDPTVCINDLVRRHNHTHGAALAEFSVEELIARTVSKTEEIIELFQSEGMHAFLDLYYKRWLHGDATVHLASEGCDARVVGLDNYGFLKVQTEQTTVSVHPDGNSFDIMKNLIIPKTR